MLEEVEELMKIDGFSENEESTEIKLRIAYFTTFASQSIMISNLSSIANTKLRNMVGSLVSNHTSLFGSRKTKIALGIIAKMISSQHQNPINFTEYGLSSDDYSAEEVKEMDHHTKISFVDDVLEMSDNLVKSYVSNNLLSGTGPTFLTDEETGMQTIMMKDDPEILQNQSFLFDQYSYELDDETEQIKLSFSDHFFDGKFRSSEYTENQNLMMNQKQVGVVVHVFPETPYLYDTNHQNESLKTLKESEVPKTVRIDFLYGSSYPNAKFSKEEDPSPEDHNDIPTQTFTFDIPGNYEKWRYEHGKSPSCAWYDRPKFTWKTDGCRLIEIFSKKIRCECNHTTDFTALIGDYIVQMNWLTPEDFGNITKLNVDNMTTLVVCVILLCLYIFGMIFLECIQCWCQCCGCGYSTSFVFLKFLQFCCCCKPIFVEEKSSKRKKSGVIDDDDDEEVEDSRLEEEEEEISSTENESPQEEEEGSKGGESDDMKKMLSDEQEKNPTKKKKKKRIFKKLVSDIFLEHKYIGLIYQPEAKITMGSRLTIFMVDLFAMMLCNALTFGIEPRDAFQFVVTVFMSNIIPIPLVSFFEFVFIKSGSKKTENNDDDDESQANESIFEDKYNKNVEELQCSDSEDDDESREDSYYVQLQNIKDFEEQCYVSEKKEEVTSDGIEDVHDPSSSSSHTTSDEISENESNESNEGEEVDEEEIQTEKLYSPTIPQEDDGLKADSEMIEEFESISEEEKEEEESVNIPNDEREQQQQQQQQQQQEGEEEKISLEEGGIEISASTPDCTLSETEESNSNRSSCSDSSVKETDRNNYMHNETTNRNSTNNKNSVVDDQEDDGDMVMMIRSLQRFQKSKSCSPKQVFCCLCTNLDGFFDFMDVLIEFVTFLVKEFCKRFWWSGIFFVCLFFIVYAFFSSVLAYVAFREMSWFGSRGVMLYSIAALIFFGVLICSMYINSKSKSYKNAYLRKYKIEEEMINNRSHIEQLKEPSWYGNWCLCYCNISCCCALCFISFVITSAFLILFAVYWNSQSEITEIVIGTLSFFGFCTIASCFWILLHLIPPKKPKRNKNLLLLIEKYDNVIIENKQKSLFIRFIEFVRYPLKMIKKIVKWIFSFRFPWFFKYLNYVLCWISLIVMFYLLVLYGIKFDSKEKGVSEKWLYGNGFSTLEDIFLQEPIWIFLKTVVFSIIMYFFEVVFD